jgi:hypothetical protein
MKIHFTKLDKKFIPFLKIIIKKKYTQSKSFKRVQSLKNKIL